MSDRTADDYRRIGAAFRTVFGGNGMDDWELGRCIIVLWPRGLRDVLIRDGDSVRVAIVDNVLRMGPESAS